MPYLLPFDHSLQSHAILSAEPMPPLFTHDLPLTSLKTLFLFHSQDSTLIPCIPLSPALEFFSCSIPPRQNPFQPKLHAIIPSPSVQRSQLPPIFHSLKLRLPLSLPSPSSCSLSLSLFPFSSSQPNPTAPFFFFSRGLSSPSSPLHQTAPLPLFSVFLHPTTANPSPTSSLSALTYSLLTSSQPNSHSNSFQPACHLPDSRPFRRTRRAKVYISKY